MSNEENLFKVLQVHLLKLIPEVAIIIVMIGIFLYKSPLNTFTIIFAVGTCFAILGLGIIVEKKNTSAGIPQIMDKKISIMTMWLPQFQFIGFFEAERQDKTLEIRIGGSPKHIDSIAMVQQGISDMAICSSVDLIYRYHTDPEFMEKGIVPCLIIFKKSPVCLIAHIERDFCKESIKGSRIAYYGSSDSTSRELLAMVDSDIKGTINRIPLDDARYLFEPMKALSDHEADYRIGYAFNEAYYGYRSKQHHWKLLSDIFQRDIYSDVLIVTKKFYENNRRRVDEIIELIINGYVKHSNTVNLKDTWQLLKDRCPDQYRQFSKIFSQENIDLVYLASKMLKTLTDFSSNRIGIIEKWHEMERLIWPKETLQQGYANQLVNIGWFKEFEPHA